MGIEMTKSECLMTKEFRMTNFEIRSFVIPSDFSIRNSPSSIPEFLMTKSFLSLRHIGLADQLLGGGHVFFRRYHSENICRWSAEFHRIDMQNLKVTASYPFSARDLDSRTIGN